jgi:hypothetical protein
MTGRQYKATLKALKLSTNGAGKPLGITPRQSFRYASGENEIPLMAERLLEMFKRHGVPEEWR